MSNDPLKVRKPDLVAPVVRNQDRVAENSQKVEDASVGRTSIKLQRGLPPMREKTAIDKKIEEMGLSHAWATAGMTVPLKEIGRVTDVHKNQWVVSRQIDPFSKKKYIYLTGRDGARDRELIVEEKQIPLLVDLLTIAIKPDNHDSHSNCS